MGAGLLQDPELSQLCDRCAEAAGIDLRRLLVEADDDELRRTENAQPALTFTGIALARLLAGRGVEPDAAAGHSVGEYAALCAGGAMDPEDAVRAVADRGRAMAEAAPAGTTTMAAVLGLDPQVLERELAALDDVWPANYNTPTQTVIAGTAAAVELAAEKLRAAGARRVVPLNVSAAFHTPLVRDAAARVRPVLDSVRWSAPRVPVVANLTAAPYRRAEEIPDVLERQLSSPVLWAQSVAALQALGVTDFVEVGPKRALTGMLRELAPGAGAASVATPEDVEALQ